MKLIDIFINSAGRLRSGWRLAIFSVLFIAFLFLLGSLVRVAFALLVLTGHRGSPGEFLENAIFRLVFLLSALVAGILCSRWLEGLSWRSLGLALHLHWFRDFLIGSGIGIASLTLATAIATFGGGLRFSTSGFQMWLPVTTTLLSSAAIFILAALAEETLFRGYPLQTLTRARLAWLGVLLTSVPFATAHLSNPNVAKGFTFVNTALAGIWLAVAYLKTRSLWFPLGVHWAWNWALGSLFGLPVSGIDTIAPHPLLHGSDLGPAWLTGGTYGIEGGVACTITLIVSTLFIWRIRWISAGPEMLELTSHENPRAFTS
jgi:hypothetical protein